jgi:hypothetical protein
MALLEECKHDLGIELTNSWRIRQGGVVLEPDPHFGQIPIGDVLATMLRFMRSQVPIELFLCGYRYTITDERLDDDGHTSCWEEMALWGGVC